MAKLTPDDGAEKDRFGYSVAISGNIAIVGAYQDDDEGINSCSAVVFERKNGNWAQMAKLTADDGAKNDYFGYSVAMSGNIAIISAYHDDDKGTDSGSALVFVLENGNWAQMAKLTADDGAASDYFGINVAIDGNIAIIGAHQDDDKGTNSGSAFVFVLEYGDWVQKAKLTADDGAANDKFGRSVAIGGNIAVVGAWWDDDNGSAYVFELEHGDWVQKFKLTGF
jgi:hypothetical protein